MVNGIYPTLPGLAEDPAEAAAAARGVAPRGRGSTSMRIAAEFRTRRRALQDAEVERMARELPLPQLRLPYLFTSELGPAELSHLADELLDQIAALSPAGQA